MNLSAEALALLDDLGFQELKGGSSFTPIAETRQAEAPDLSGKELADLRSLDFSGVTARLDGLTFAGRPPAPMPAPEAAAGSLAKAKEKIRNFLKSRKGQKTTISERAPEAAAVETGVEKGMVKWLEKIDFGKLAKEGVRYLIPPLTGLTLGRLLPPEQALNLTQTAFAVGMLGFIGSGGCAVAERVVSGHPRIAGIARLLAAGKVLGAVFAETGMLMSAGSFIGGLWHEREIVRQAAAQMGQPEVTGAGGGEWPSESRFASSQPAAATEAPSGAVGGGISPADQPSPVEDWTDAAGAEPPAEAVGGGISPADQPSPVEDWTDAAGAEPPAEAVGGDTEAPTATAGSESTATVGPTVTTEPTATGTEALPAAGAPEAALEAATRVVEVQSGDTLTDLVARAGGDPYGADFTNTVLQSADVLTGPQNPNRDMARALIEFIKAHPGGVNWRDAMNGVGDLAKEVVGGRPLKDAIAQATRMVYPGQMMKVVVGAAGP